MKENRVRTNPLMQRLFQRVNPVGFISVYPNRMPPSF
jgi:hypothetical protein